MAAKIMTLISGGVSFTAKPVSAYLSGSMRLTMHRLRRTSGSAEAVRPCLTAWRLQTAATFPSPAVAAVLDGGTFLRAFAGVGV